MCEDCRANICKKCREWRGDNHFTCAKCDVCIDDDDGDVFDEDSDNYEDTDNYDTDSCKHHEFVRSIAPDFTRRNYHTILNVQHSESPIYPLGYTESCMENTPINHSKTSKMCAFDRSTQRGSRRVDGSNESTLCYATVSGATVRWSVWHQSDAAGGKRHMAALMGRGPQDCVHSSASAASALRAVRSLGYANMRNESGHCAARSRVRQRTASKLTPPKKRSRNTRNISK